MNRPMRSAARNQNSIFTIRARAAGKTLSITILLVGVAILAAPSALAQTYQTFDAPSSGTVAYLGTIPLGINTPGAVVGITLDASNAAHGFLRAANGSITAINVSGAGAGSNQGTFTTSINDGGVIAGAYAGSGIAYHGFVRAANGTVTFFDAGSAIGKHQGTIPTAINKAGVITGMYKDSSSQYHGFVRSANGESITIFDAAGAGTGYAVGTLPLGINNAGVITGFYIAQNGARHGFTCSGSCASSTTIDAPGAGSGTNQGTVAIGINTAGVIAGQFASASQVAGGFVRAASGTITTFAAPAAEKNVFLSLLAVLPAGGGPSVQGTNALSINSLGVITGVYSDSAGSGHGFLRSAKGAITGFLVPAGGTGMLQGTIATGINTAGLITGPYADSSSVFHGFVLIPPTPTTTGLSSSPSPSIYGQTVTLTATVSSSSGAPPDGETVTFTEGATTLGTGTLSGGSAILMASTLKVGSNSVKAIYGGDQSFAASAAKAVSQVVAKASTTTTLLSSLNPSNVGQSVTFTAGVTPQFSGTPTGKVTFYDGSTILKAVAVSAGMAKFTTSKLSAGGHTIKAAYGGSTSFDDSSASLTQTVD